MQHMDPLERKRELMVSGPDINDATEKNIFCALLIKQADHLG